MIVDNLGTLLEVGSVRRCVAGWIDLRHFRGKRQAGAGREPESGFFLQEGYRQEFSVDWPEAAKCPLVGLLDDLRQLRWHAEFAGEVRDRCELLTAPVQPEGREVVLRRAARRGRPG